MILSFKYVKKKKEEEKKNYIYIIIKKEIFYSTSKYCVAVAFLSSLALALLTLSTITSSAIKHCDIIRLLQPEIGHGIEPPDCLNKFVIADFENVCLQMLLYSIVC